MPAAHCDDIDVGLLTPRQLPAAHALQADAPAALQVPAGQATGNAAVEAGRQ